MKPTIDTAAVSGLATAALLRHVVGDWQPNDVSMPEDPAALVVDLEVLCKQHPGRDGTVDGIVRAFDYAFQFGLQLGARIGADPLHAPEVKDLIADFRFIKEERAA